MENFSFMAFTAFLKSLEVHPVIDASVSQNKYAPLDLSIHNSKLKHIDISSSNDLEVFVWDYMKTQNAKVAYGGYLEQRGIYQRSTYFNKENPETERNIHLGIDLWIEAETAIYAPLDATIHSFKNNTNYGDYGPTIVLKHCIDNVMFYTLYGHLSEASIANLKTGVEVKQGQQIATLGTAEVNGDYPPHLHFQVIKDLQNFTGDYPGVSNQLDLEFYKTNCPDPNLILGLI